MTDEQIKESARKLLTAYEKMKENDGDFYEDFVEVMFRELFEPKKTINKESKIKNENT